MTGRLAADTRVAGLAVTSMGEAGVLVDAAGRPLFPVLTWHDRRTGPSVAWWRARLRDTEVYRNTGMPQDHIYSAPQAAMVSQPGSGGFCPRPLVVVPGRLDHLQADRPGHHQLQYGLTHHAL